MLSYLTADNAAYHKITYALQSTFRHLPMFTLQTGAPGCEFLAREGDALTAQVDVTLYTETALLATTHRFTDRCYVFLERGDGPVVVVRFQAKERGGDLGYVAREFLNALLDQTLREQVQRDTEGVRNLLFAHALSQVSLIRPELETAEPLDDPDGVAVPDRTRNAPTGALGAA